MERDPLIPLLLEAPTAQSLAGPGVWERIRQGSAAEGVAQIIAYAVRPHAGVEERAWCDKVLTGSWTRHERSLANLSHVAGVLAEAGVDFIALKGPALACRAYEPPFLRKPSLDLDFAVRRSDIEKARDALARAGYSEQAAIDRTLACGHHLVLSHARSMSVELHFRLSHGAMGIPVDEFFSRAVPWRLPDGREISVLAPADELLQLILHIAHDRFATLFHVYEVRRIWRAASLHLRRDVISFAVQHRFSGVLLLVDLAFQDLWGETFLPPGVPIRKTWLHWRLDPAMFHAFRDSVRPGMTHTFSTRMRAGWLELQITDSPLDALRFARAKGRLAWNEMRGGRWRPIEKGRQIPIG